MNDTHNGTRGPQPQEQRCSLVHWDRVDWATPRCADASREPTRLEWVLATTLANATAVANAPFCDSGDGKDTLSEVDLRRVIAIIAERIDTGALDRTILLLRDTLKHCIRRGDSSLFAAKSAAEEDMDMVVG